MAPGPALCVAALSVATALWIAVWAGDDDDAGRLQFAITARADLPAWDAGSGENASSPLAGTGIVTFPALFSAAECARILREARRVAPERRGQIGGAASGTNHDNTGTRRSTVRGLPRDHKAFNWVYARIAQAVRHASARGEGVFALPQSGDAFERGVGFEALQLARYDGGDEGFYDWHQDDGYAGEPTGNRRVSLTVQLSDAGDYDGGALEIMPGVSVRVPVSMRASRRAAAGEALAASRRQGSATLFSSCLMHRVAPVRRGSRHSLVQWVTTSAGARPRSNAWVEERLIRAQKAATRAFAARAKGGADGATRHAGEARALYADVLRAWPLDAVRNEVHDRFKDLHRKWGDPHDLAFVRKMLAEGATPA